MIRSFYVELYGGSGGAPKTEMEDYCEVVRGNLCAEDVETLLYPVTELEVRGF